MTLNVIVQNMVAVDSEVSYQHTQRTTDDAEKSELFQRSNYHGILIGNGSSYNIRDAMLFVRKSSEGELENMLHNLKEYLFKKEKEMYKKHLDEVEEKIRTKYSLISDPAKREEAVHKDFAAATDQMREQIEKAPHNGTLHIVAYDKQQKDIRKFLLVLRPITGAVLHEVYLQNITADGSGGDLAGAYLATQTSGIQWDKVTPEYNFYLTVLACAAATANDGVGGFMQLAVIKPESVNYIEPERVNAAVRVTSKQIAGEIGKKEAMGYIHQIYNGEANFHDVAQALDITENDLLYAPCRLHQDVSKFNRMLVLAKK